MGRAGCDGGTYQVSAQSVIPLRNGRSAPALGPIENVLKMTKMACISETVDRRAKRSSPFASDESRWVGLGVVVVCTKFRPDRAKGGGRAGPRPRSGQLKM